MHIDGNEKMEYIATDRQWVEHYKMIADYHPIVKSNKSIDDVIKEILLLKGCPTNIIQSCMTPLPLITVIDIESMVRIKAAYHNAYIALEAMLKRLTIYRNPRYVIGYRFTKRMAFPHAWVRDVNRICDPTWDLLLSKNHKYHDVFYGMGSYYPVLELTMHQVNKLMVDLDIDCSPDLDHVLNWFKMTGEQIPWACE